MHRSRRSREASRPDLGQLKDSERQKILDAYAMFQQNKKRTARALGIALNTLKRRLREYGIDD